MSYGSLFFKFPDVEIIEIDSRRMTIFPNNGETINWNGEAYIVENVEHNFQEGKFLNAIMILRKLII